MELTLTFIRGAFTHPGREGRFLGRIDAPLHPDGLAQLSEKARSGRYPTADAVFSSPLMRCTESARVIYPYSNTIVTELLADFDYGEFSGKAYGEIIAHEQFGNWAKADTLRAFPGGEAPYIFIGRCLEALREVIAYMQQGRLASASIVTHQAVIRAILQRNCLPHCVYGDYKLDYGGGITVECDAHTTALKMLERF